MPLTFAVVGTELGALTSFIFLFTFPLRGKLSDYPIEGTKFSPICHGHVMCIVYFHRN